MRLVEQRDALNSNSVQTCRFVDTPLLRAMCDVNERFFEEGATATRGPQMVPEGSVSHLSKYRRPTSVNRNIAICALMAGFAGVFVSPELV